MYKSTIGVEEGGKTRRRDGKRITVVNEGENHHVLRQSKSKLVICMYIDGFI